MAVGGGVRWMWYEGYVGGSISHAVFSDILDSYIMFTSCKIQININVYRCFLCFYSSSNAPGPCPRIHQPVGAHWSTFSMLYPAQLIS